MSVWTLTTGVTTDVYTFIHRDEYLLDGNLFFKQIVHNNKSHNIHYKSIME